MIYKYGKIVLNKGKDVGFNMYEDEVLLCNVETREGKRETNENRDNLVIWGPVFLNLELAKVLNERWKEQWVSIKTTTLAN